MSNTEFWCAMLIGPIIVHLSPKFPTIQQIFFILIIFLKYIVLYYMVKCVWIPNELPSVSNGEWKKKKFWRSEI